MSSSAERPTQDTPELLRRLLDAGVELVVVGGVAAVPHGSAQFTKDLDITAPFTSANIQRLMSILRPLAPRFYQTLGKPPAHRSDDELATFKNLYLHTDLGIVDVLSAVPPLESYAAIAGHASEMDLFARRCLVIALDDLVEVKAYVGRPKDKLGHCATGGVRPLDQTGRLWRFWA
jgi:hypothetical protein